MPVPDHDRRRFLRAAGLLDLWARGYVEPILPAPTPYHLFAQQIMALALQTGGLGTQDWQGWIGEVPCFRAMGSETQEILQHMLDHGVLAEDQGRWWFGHEGQQTFGFKNFLELYSIFTSTPLFTVLHGRTDLGLVHESSFAGSGKNGAAVLLLGGRSWLVRSLDWSHRVAYVEPAPEGGSSRWCGGSRVVHFDHAQAMRRVLATGELQGVPTKRATEAMVDLRTEFPWVAETSTALVRSGSDNAWWTFAGLRANSMLALALGDLVDAPTVKDNLAIPLKSGVGAEHIRQRLEGFDPAVTKLPVAEEQIEELKFGQCLPPHLAARMLSTRAADARGAASVASEPVRSVVM